MSSAVFLNAFLTLVWVTFETFKKVHEIHSECNSNFIKIHEVHSVSNVKAAITYVVDLTTYSGYGNQELIILL